MHESYFPRLSQEVYGDENNYVTKKLVSDLFAQEQWRTEISSGQRPHEQRAQRVGSHAQ